MLRERILLRRVLLLAVCFLAIFAQDSPDQLFSEDPIVFISEAVSGQLCCDQTPLTQNGYLRLLRPLADRGVGLGAASLFVLIIAAFLLPQLSWHRPVLIKQCIRIHSPLATKYCSQAPPIFQFS